jgi:hypothetical protein
MYKLPPPGSAGWGAAPVLIALATDARFPGACGDGRHKGRIASNGRDDQPQGTRRLGPLLGIPNHRIGRPEPIGKVPLAQFQFAEPQPEQVTGKVGFSKVRIKGHRHSFGTVSKLARRVLAQG